MMIDTDAHQPRLLYKFFRRLVRRIAFIETPLMAFLRWCRVHKAKGVLRAMNFHPKDARQILLDYEYSIRETHRGIMQVLNIESVIRYVEEENIEGAFVETGTYTGGASAYALRALLRLRVGRRARHYWGFDSFEGMPSSSEFDGDHGSIWLTGKALVDSGEVPGSLVGHNTNKANYEQCLSYLTKTGYPTDNIHLVKGWFQHTLPHNKDDVGRIAILRLDGDFYDSTKITFDALYELVAPKGIVIIDDYGGFEGCRRATDEFLAKLPERPHLVYVDNCMRYFVKP